MWAWIKGLEKSKSYAGKHNGISWK
jgi:hypothetical protein